MTTAARTIKAYALTNGIVITSKEQLVELAEYIGLDVKSANSYTPDTCMIAFTDGTSTAFEFNKAPKSIRQPW